MIRFLLASIGALVGLILTIPLVLVAGPFWFIAALARGYIKVLGRFRASEVPWQDMVAFDPDIGWRPKGDLQLKVRAERTVHVTTDPEGWRGRARLDDSDVVVFGDSYAFGHGTDDEAFFADRVPGHVVKAIGADGYNLVQELQWMKRFGSRLEGKLVIWMVFYGNDLFDNMTPALFGYRKPFVRKRPVGAEWEMVTEHIREEPWPLPAELGHIEALAEICCSNHRSDRAFESTAAILKWGRDILAELGAGLVVVGHPDPTQVDPARAVRLAEKAPDPASYDPGMPDKRLEAICDELDIRFASLTPRMTTQDFLVADVHWTPAGNDKMAALVAELAETGPGLVQAGVGARAGSPPEDAA